jgi:hypothetical protein
MVVYEQLYTTFFIMIKPIEISLSITDTAFKSVAYDLNDRNKAFEILNTRNIYFNTFMTAFNNEVNFYKYIIKKLIQ